MNDGAGSDPLLVAVAKELRQKEVAVGLVGISLNQKLLRGGSALNIHALTLRALFGEDGCHGRLAKLKLGLEAKKTLNPGDQAPVGRKADVAHLKALEDVVLLTFKVELDFVFKRKGGLCIKVEVQVEPVAELSGGADLHLLVKVECEGPPVAFRNNRVLNVLVAKSKAKFRTSRRADLELVRTKNIPQDGIGDVHVRHNARAVAV